ncbi:RES family NAD+ phosphorylase [Staphylococcus sp. EZ-P03]|uniref:RES family NAD+ phosphorylase n=1 Tax=Staphylococcus sp. EZ-P03 TaxID=2282739 RepID=UPI000DF74E51|nr:RES family NAD+ phosphorylase [Staphylococcus sp. EZ-P03]
MKICEKCFRNSEIKEILKNSNAPIGQCDIDPSHKNVHIFDTSIENETLQVVRDCLRPILDIYSISSDLPENYSIEKLYTLSHALRNDWAIFNVEDPQIKEIVISLFKNDNDVDSRLFEQQVGARILTDKTFLKENLILKNNDWNLFCEELKYNQRFHNNMISLQNLKVFIEATRISIPVHEFNSQIPHLYRARIVDFISQQSEIMAPPKDAVTPGRLNAQWIRVLYLSTSPTICVDECRPKHNDIVYVGEIQLKDNNKLDKKSLLIADLSDFTSKSLNRGLEEVSKYYVNYDVIKQIQNGISEPSSSQGQDYIPFQYIADFIKSLGYDGIKYSSIFDTTTFNYMFFEPELFECKYWSKKIVTNVSLKLENTD